MGLSILDPCRVAVVATAVLVVLLFITRRLGPRGAQLELRLLAAFLIGMPLVYVARVLMTGAQAFLWLEVLALPVFAALAFSGLKWSPWFLVAGIAIHGVGWDSWHYRRSAYIPDWYSAGCFLVDLALAAYVVSRISAYRQATKSSS